MVKVTGFKPVAPRARGECSIRLSYTLMYMVCTAGAAPATPEFQARSSAVDLRADVLVDGRPTKSDLSPRYVYGGLGARRHAVGLDMSSGV